MTGTFTVPALTTAATCSEIMSEWVGIDGLDNASLIQAGIGEGMTNLENGTCTPGQFYIYPWWEILPASETIIPSTSVAVNVGDQITVTIKQIGETTNWQIALTDDTDGQSFTTEQVYTGVGNSAEWIVEAPDDPSLCGTGVYPLDPGICPLAPYSPDINFTDLVATGSETTMWQLFMVQDNVFVSVPSTFTANSFTASYGSVQAGTDATNATGTAQLAQSRQPVKTFMPDVYEK